MKEATEKLLDKAEKVHDWNKGQVYGHSGDMYTRTDECRICGMKRDSLSYGTQNEMGKKYAFIILGGEEISLKEAVARGCIKQEE